MLEDALSYPTNGESGLVRILIGGVFGVLSVLVLPAFVVAGYMLRAMAGASRGDPEPPAFEDWGGLFVDGLKATAASLAYAFGPILLMVVFVVVIGAGASAGSESTAGALAGLGILTILLLVVLLFVIQYAVPAALTNLGREGSLGAAFDFETLKPVLTSGEYLKAVLLVFGISMVGGMALSVFTTVTFGVGLVVTPFFYFWLYLAGSYMFGTAFGHAVDASGGRADPQGPAV
ncbi:DUF4013 domain-containing protein [Halorussus halobius]|uniref:DUF4013 domain-containing protein n=1 Tax=Halorussus halobius TaxID=1710537 RepID=UPI0010927072|nr:DUF4013 domain-containing protein [Halorussus halobius]